MTGDLVLINQVKNEPDQVLDKITRALKGIKHGEVVIKVHAGKVIFVERHERERID